MINFLKLALAGLVSSLFLVGCGTNAPTPGMKGSFYSQTNIWQEKGKHLSTNYSRGSLIPVNTEVNVINYSGKVLNVKVVSTGETVALINIAKFSKLDVPGLFKRSFAKTKVDTSKYSKEVQNQISLGTVSSGMTKEEVLISRGFPPAHVTNIKTANTWKYWQNRFVTRNVSFIDGKVSGQSGWGAQK